MSKQSKQTSEEKAASPIIDLTYTPMFKQFKQISEEKTASPIIDLDQSSEKEKVAPLSIDLDRFSEKEKADILWALFTDEVAMGSLSSSRKQTISDQFHGSNKNTSFVGVINEMVRFLVVFHESEGNYK